ncbi:MAG: hypothetical protein AB1Z22_01450 [Synechococcaceae cyanobacterium]
MAQPLGSGASLDISSPTGQRAGQAGGVFVATKKKGCKEKKCSNWKGGKCRCGRD